MSYQVNYKKLHSDLSEAHTNLLIAGLDDSAAKVGDALISVAELCRAEKDNSPTVTKCIICGASLWTDLDLLHRICSDCPDIDNEY